MCGKPWSAMEHCQEIVLLKPYWLSYTLISSCLQCLRERWLATVPSHALNATVGCETIVYCFSAQLASWWSSLICKAIHSPWLHIICSPVEMIGLISRLGISCNYWDGISTVTMINGYLTLFVMASHRLSRPPVSEISLAELHKHRNISEPPSISWTENHSVKTQIIFREIKKNFTHLTILKLEVNLLCQTAAINLVYLTFPSCFSAIVAWDYHFSFF